MLINAASSDSAEAQSVDSCVNFHEGVGLFLDS